MPKVIEDADLSGASRRNGIQLNVKARVTVRTNLDRYVGGAGEPTIIARVGEGVRPPRSVRRSITRKCSSFRTASRRQSSRRASTRGTAFRDRVDRHRRRRRRQEHRCGNCRRPQAEADRRIAQAKAAERQIRRARGRTGAEGGGRKRCVPRSSRPRRRFRRRSPKRSVRGPSRASWDYYRLKQRQGPIPRCAPRSERASRRPIRTRVRRRCRRARASSRGRDHRLARRAGREEFRATQRKRPAPPRKPGRRTRFPASSGCGRRRAGSGPPPRRERRRASGIVHAAAGRPRRAPVTPAPVAPEALLGAFFERSRVSSRAFVALGGARAARLAARAAHHVNFSPPHVV